MVKWNEGPEKSDCSQARGGVNDGPTGEADDVRQGRRQLVAGLAHAAALVAIGVGVIAMRTARADDAAAKAAASGTAAAAGGLVPYWQAPALPTAVIQGGAIPAGWQPQAIPYQGVGPDGRPLTMYFAPTYVFTYQSGPPVLAAPPVNRRGPAPAPTYAPYGAYGWNYQSQGATAVPVALPPASVARYQPAPYQFPADARALSGTPLVPPSTPLPGPPAPPGSAPSPYGATPPPALQQPLAAPPAQWVPSNVAPPPGVAPQQGQGWSAAAPVAAAAVPLATAAAMTSSNPAPTASLTPVAPITSLPPQAPAAVAATPVSSGPASNTHLWKVVGVHDGDTVTCIDENNQQQKIRLAEIDAPEVSQDFGKVSREALAGMVFGKTIEVVDDGKDRYGRWIGRLYVDGLDVNRQMVATGMAWHYAAYSKDSSLAALQSQAQAQRLGLWSQPNPMPPWDYRKSGKQKAA